MLLVFVIDLHVSFQLLVIVKIEFFLFLLNCFRLLVNYVYRGHDSVTDDIVVGDITVLDLFVL